MVTLATLYNDFKTLIKQNFYDKTETDDLLDEKQDTLVSGTNIKTINNNSLLGSGNISISASGTVDTALDTSSTNPVQNKAIATEINSLNTSITNLVTVERVSLVKTNANLTNHSSVDLSTTITIPSGYKVLDYYTRNYTGVTDVSRLELNNTTLSVRGWNHTGMSQSNVYIYVGVLYIRDI